MNRSTILLALLIGTFSWALSGCGGGSGGGSGKTYAGAMPIGDYVAVTVNETNQTLTYHNYTTGESFGPISYSKLTTGNGGFQNIYQTETFTREGNQCYADFVIMKDVALSFLLFDASLDQPVDWPVYALNRRTVDMNDYKGRAYNWLKCEIDETSNQGNFECGFAAFDTDNTGLMYGASYNRRAAADPIKTINASGIGTSSFTYNSNLVANTYGDLTLIGTPSGDFALDFGPGNGAGFAVRQGASKDWNSNYNGNYLAMVYKNGSAVVESYQTPRFLMKPMRVTLSGGVSGNIVVAELEGTEHINGSLTSLVDFTNGPIAGEKVTESFRKLSSCDSVSVSSPTVKEAYKCHGSFIYNYNNETGSQLVNIFSDPNGRFIFFNAFIEEGTETTYFFGFGIKDPYYQPQ